METHRTYNSQEALMKNEAEQQTPPISRLKKQQWSRQHEQTDPETSMSKTSQGKRVFSARSGDQLSVPNASKVRFAAHLCSRQEN